LDRPDSRPKKAPAEDQQRPGKPLPSQADRYTTAIWIGCDQSDIPAEPAVAATAARPQFGVKPKSVKKKQELLEPIGGLWSGNLDDGDIPF
jgi:hypothetical protein